MEGKFRFLAIFIFVALLFACHRGSRDDIIMGPYVPAISSPTKIQVVDVSNDTREVFDVDVIGLLWTGLDDSLKKRGMYWTKEAGGKQYLLEAHVVKYRKGTHPGRLIPRMGDTVLVVKCELRDGDRQIATIESKRKIGFGDMLLSREAWRKIFSEVAEDVINQATRKL